MEALRWISYLRKGGKMVVNDYEIPSMPIIMGVAKYPEGIIEDLTSKADVSVLQAGKMAIERGNSKTMNLILLGALVKAMGLADHPEIDWEQVIRSNLKPEYAEINVLAFRLGLDQVE